MILTCISKRKKRYMTKTSEYIQSGITNCIMILTGSINCTSYIYRIMAVTRLAWNLQYTERQWSTAKRRHKLKYWSSLTACSTGLLCLCDELALSGQALAGLLPRGGVQSLTSGKANSFTPARPCIAAACMSSCCYCTAALRHCSYMTGTSELQNQICL